uniref:hypothetical protein n=1 Tax=Cellvibrio fontiphilus TaxID=1815559 RepID=UPI002B4BCBC8|nr:hypothetical protein [Cellvibrio fontiphilus]
MNLWPYGKPRSLVTPWVITADAACPLNELGDQLQLLSACLIVPRQYLFYLYIDLSSVPNALRKNFIQQRLQQLSPFSNPESCLVQEADGAQLWFWDSRLLSGRREQTPGLPQVTIPESLLRRPFQDGFRVQPCIHGWELQYWETNSLRYTRWLANRPDTVAKDDFVRTCGYNMKAADWSDAGAELLSAPWNEKPFWSKATLSSEPVATRLIAGVLLAWIFLELGMGLGTIGKQSYLSSSVESQSEALSQLVDQRDAALRQKDFNQAIADLIAAPTPLWLSAQVHSCLADFDFVILDWQYQRGQLVVLLEKEGLDTRALIESCAANPGFSDVRVEPGITPAQTRVLFSLPQATQEGNDDV